MNLSSHPVTRAYKTPENTPHKILIAFCEVLDMHPHELIRDYQIGVLRILDIEKAYHEKRYEALDQS